MRNFRTKITEQSTEIMRDPLLDKELVKSLLIRPLPLADEQVHGYWLRLVHLNGLNFTRWLLANDAYLPKGSLLVCPTCLAEPDTWWREAWTDRDHPWCKTHKQWLVDTCTSCSRLFRWPSVKHLQCRCGQALGELPTSALTPECWRALVHERTAPLSVLVWLGALAKRTFYDNPLRKATHQGMAHVVDLATRGAAMVNDWPGDFFRALDACRVYSPGNASLQLLNTTLPGLTRRIRMLKDPMWRKHIDEALGAYATASKQTSFPIIGRNLGARDTAYDPIANVAKTLGVGTNVLIRVFDNLADDQTIARRTANGRSRRLLTPEVIQKVQSHLEDQISTKTAANILGLTPARVNQLVSANFLVRNAEHLSKEECHTLLKSVMQACSLEDAPDDAIPLNEELRLRITVDRTSELISAILSGRLEIYAGSNKNSIRSLLLGRKRAKSWIAMRSESRSEWLTIPDCAHHLGIKQEVVYHLVRIGLLTTQKARGKRHIAQIVALEELEKFERSYEPLTKTASREGVGNRHSLSWARERNLKLVSGPAIDGGRQYFIRIRQG